MEFPTTQWSLLAQATLHGDSAGREALGEFFRRYREPIRSFIQRRGASAAEAEDLAQGFFVHVMEETTLRRADEARGRFRSFLLGALIRFLARAHDRRSTQKRGGGETPVPLDALTGFDTEPAIPPADVQAYDRDWAVHLLEQALAAVETEYAARGRTAEFAILRAYLPGSPAAPPYEEAARQLECSLGSLKVEVHRLRERLRGVVRREIAATVAPEDVEDEVAYLGRVLRAANP
jgi:RNA polymerase sigma factor (sigma-70 family)